MVKQTDTIKIGKWKIASIEKEIPSYDTEIPAIEVEKLLILHLKLKEMEKKELNKHR